MNHGPNNTKETTMPKAWPAIEECEINIYFASRSGCWVASATPSAPDDHRNRSMTGNTPWAAMRKLELTFTQSAR
jgi:hypothetical protein